MKELIKTIDWQPHSVRGFIGGILGKKWNLTINSTNGENGDRGYSVDREKLKLTGKLNLKSSLNQSSFLDRLWSAPRRLLLAVSGILVLVIAYLDWISPDLSLGAAFILAVLPAALTLSRWQIVIFGSFLAAFRCVFINSSSLTELFLRFLLGLFAYWATGLFVVEMIRNRRLMLQHTLEMEKEHQLRREAESHLRVLAESSPAAILTIDERAQVISANQSACDMLGVREEDQLLGLSIDDYLPVLADALKMGSDSPNFRTAAQCRAHRLNGDIFLAQTWFSTYNAGAGRRVAAIIVDISEETREREGQNLRYSLANNRIVAAAVSHEMRNLCGATRMVYSKLAAAGPFETNDEFRAMGSLLDALSKLASAELNTRSAMTIGHLNLIELLTQFRVIIEPDWQEMGGAVEWTMPSHLPMVLGQPYGLLQVLMNLAQNSLRAVQTVEQKHLKISATVEANRVLLSVVDSGAGVSKDAPLFEPFKSGHEQTGLGLYVSRAIVRSYGGDLRHEPTEKGCRFVVELSLAKKEGSGD